ncbi:hypothetical protein BG004_003024 [Podila humilis]|nr:hypothetical protein BG004_003024 [Podila humilis]
MESTPSRETSAAPAITPPPEFPVVSIPNPNEKQNEKTTQPAEKHGEGAEKMSKQRFSNEDIDIILTWLETDGNYASIWGISGKTSRASSTGYRNLFEYMKTKSKRWNDNNLSPRAVKERFARYKMKTYLPAKALIDAAGFGVAEDDWKNGISTIAHKKESLCHGYNRMEALFGNRPTVAPRSSQRENGYSSGESEGEPDDVIDEGTTEEPGTGYKATFDVATQFPDDGFEHDGVEGVTMNEMDAFQEPDYETLVDDDREGQENQPISDVAGTIHRKRRRPTLDNAAAASRKAPPSLRSNESSRPTSILADAVIMSADKMIKGRKLDFQKDIEGRKLELEYRKLNVQVDLQMMRLAQEAVSRGKSEEEVDALLSVLDKHRTKI